jgi:hypothetical protein
VNSFGPNRKDEANKLCNSRQTRIPIANLPPAVWPGTFQFVTLSFFTLVEIIFANSSLDTYRASAFMP